MSYGNRPYLAICLAIYSVLGLSLGCSHRETSDRSLSSDGFDRIPSRITNFVPALYSRSPIRRTIPNELPKNLNPNLSLLFHMMMLLGLETEVKIGERAERLIDIVSSDELSKELLGSACIVLVNNGVRFPSESRGSGRSGDESHRDQSLCCFARLGIPLNHKLTVSGTEQELRFVLQDSIANFDLRQTELEWTATAYALYLPCLKQRNWTNKFGERFNFDQLVAELVGRDLSRASCGGTHILIAASVLFRVNRVTPILGDKSAKQLRKYLVDCVQKAELAQLQNGEWPRNWAIGFSASEPSASALPDDITPVLFTGHILEWLFTLPPEIQPSPIVFDLAMSFSRSRTRRLNSENYFRNFCPYTHLLLALNSTAVADAIAVGLDAKTIEQQAGVQQ